MKTEGKSPTKTMLLFCSYRTLNPPRDGSAGQFALAKIIHRIPGFKHSVRFEASDGAERSREPGQEPRGRRLPMQGLQGGQGARCGPLRLPCQFKETVQPFNDCNGRNIVHLAGNVLRFRAGRDTRQSRLFP